MRDWKSRKEEEGALKEATDRKIKEGQRHCWQLGTAWEKSRMPSGLPATQELQWTVRADKQGRVGMDTIYNLLVICEGSWDELHILFKLSGLRRGTHLGLISKQQMEKDTLIFSLPEVFRRSESCAVLAPFWHKGLCFSPQWSLCAGFWLTMVI